jgi:hypothetical protein
MANRRKYKSPAKVCITAEGWLRETIVNLGHSDPEIYAIGLDTLFRKYVQNGRIPSAQLIQFLEDKKAERVALDGVIDSIEVAIIGRAAKEKERERQEKKILKALKEVLGINGQHVRRLPESDPDDNFWQWWEEQASLVSAKAGIRVTPEDCQKYVRRCSA